ncbi:hypothetical protein M407DRAFT_33250 [Tulasnella calospora MUT 4182]|uniref:Uncharacterized protein n=1 Tax=Tulasnella calospora MUT 4182 TaxID=1051891 RepID=A0A0C3Q2M5_9AGAM|nr:hypothetical protein M407DRAFT_33250 [Tulasnella calospora MUT 4182]
MKAIQVLPMSLVAYGCVRLAVAGGPQRVASLADESTSNYQGTPDLRLRVSVGGRDLIGNLPRVLFAWVGSGYGQ